MTKTSIKSKISSGKTAGKWARDFYNNKDFKKSTTRKVRRDGKKICRLPLI